MTPTDFTNPPIKRLNLLESAAQQAAQQAAAFQQRAHLLQAAGQVAGLPTLNPNGGGSIGLNGMNGMNGINSMNTMSSMNSMNLLGNKSTSNDSDPGRMPHRLIEKKRRDRINSCINQLQFWNEKSKDKI